MDGLGTAKRLWALDSPTFTIDKADLMVNASGEVTIPMPAYLIEHPRGLVLFDTGLVPDAMDDPFAVYGELADLTRLSARPEHRLDRQIRALGYEVASHTLGENAMHLFIRKLR